jgi:ribosomal protein S18 acetylase RimI-like enzyme
MAVFDPIFYRYPEVSEQFVTLTTMDWEALPFYRKLGYEVEFVREGYEKNSKMYALRKNLK